jgi:hypothetical protein
MSDILVLSSILFERISFYDKLKNCAF